jgi:hypothetical protein
VTDCNGEENGENSLVHDMVNDEGMKGEGSFEKMDTYWARETGQKLNG